MEASEDGFVQSDGGDEKRLGPSCGSLAPSSRLLSRPNSEPDDGWRSETASSSSVGRRRKHSWTSVQARRAVDDADRLRRSLRPRSIRQSIHSSGHDDDRPDSRPFLTEPPEDSTRHRSQPQRRWYRSPTHSPSVYFSFSFSPSHLLFYMAFTFNCRHNEYQR